MGNLIRKLYFCHTEALLARAHEKAEPGGTVGRSYTICGYHRQALVQQYVQGTAINKEGSCSFTGIALDQRLRLHEAFCP